MKFQKTFGPVVIDRGDEMVARCIAKGDDTFYDCVFHIGGHCTDGKPSRALPNYTDNRAPDWCQYRASALDDAQEMTDFHTLGLDVMTRPELLRAVRNISDEFKPKPLTKASAYKLRRSIRAARLADGAAAGRFDV